MLRCFLNGVGSFDKNGFVIWLGSLFLIMEREGVAILLARIVVLLCEGMDLNFLNFEETVGELKEDL